MTNNNPLARLASRETASFKNLDIENNPSGKITDELKAVTTLKNHFNISLASAKQLRKDMTERIQRSDLTINFNAVKMFSGNIPGGWMNSWERNSFTSDHLRKTRELVEEKLFKYSSRTTGPTEAVNRARTYGSQENNNIQFVPGVRPGYGALNYTRYTYGAAAHEKYGNSFLTLKEHVKHNCTYTACDSFLYASQRNAADQVGTFVNLDRVIHNMPPNMLDALNRMVNSPQDSFRVQFYIEAQIHGEVLFSRDVQRISIVKSEIQYKPLVRLYIMLFALKYGIEVKYI